MNASLLCIPAVLASLAACGSSGSVAATAPLAPDAPDASSASATSTSTCSPPPVIATAPGEFATSLAVAGDTLYWTAVESDGGGVVWRAPKCTGAPRIALARGRTRPASIVVDGARVA